MIKELVYYIQFNHPDKPICMDTWSTSYPTRLEFKDIDQQLDMLKKQWKAIGGNIVTVTLDVEDDYVDYDEAIKRTHYQWDGKQIKKIKEFDCSKD